MRIPTIVEARTSSRLLILAKLLLPLACVVIAAPERGHVFGCNPAPANPIVGGNSKQGMSPRERDVSGVGDSRIQGFATEISMAQDSIRPAKGVGMAGTAVQASSGLINGSTGLTVAGGFPWITYDMWLDFERDTVGEAMKATELAHSTHGTAGRWSTAHQSTLLTTQTAGQAPDAAFGDTGNRGMALDLTSGSVGFIQWNLPRDKSALSFGLWYKTGRPSAWVQGPHFITLFNDVSGPLERLSDERSSSTNARQIRVSPLDVAVTGIADNTWYWCTMKWVQRGKGSFSVYDTALNLVGTVSFTNDTGFAVQSILLGNSQRTTGASGTAAYFDDLIVDYTDADFPLLPKRSLAPLAVTLASASLGEGRAQHFMATRTFSVGTARNLTYPPTWTLTNAAVVPIAGAGMATGAATCDTTIQASWSSITGSTNPRFGNTRQLVRWTADDSGASSSEMAHLNSLTIGNLMLVFSDWHSQTLTASVSVSVRNIYVPIGEPVNPGTASRFQVCCAKNIGGGPSRGVALTHSGKTTSFSPAHAVVMLQAASDSFHRSSAASLGSNWSPLMGSVNVALQIANGQLRSAPASPSLAKEKKELA